MSVLTEEQQASIISEAMESIKTAVIERATNQASYTAKNAIQASVTKIVSEFIQEEIAPDIVAALVASKETIITAAVVSAESMATQLAKAMTDKFAENVASSYNRDKIIAALFK